MISKYKYHLALTVIIIAHLVLLLNLVFFPYPEFFVYSYLTESGLLPYKQIFDQHFPGLMFFPVNLSSLGLLSVEAMRAMQLLLVLATQVTLFVTAKEVFKSERKALFANVLYLLWQPYFEGYVLWIDSFVAPLLLLSFYYFYKWSQKGSRKYLYKTSLLLGIALLFKQVVLPLVGLVAIYILLRRKNTKEAFMFLLGPVFAGLFLAMYFYWIGVFEDFWFWTVKFNLTTFSQMGRKLPNLGGLLKMTTVYGFAALFLVRKYLTKSTIKKQSVEIYIFLLGSLVFAYARFDFIHLQPSLPFALIILLITVSLFNKRLALILVSAHFVIAVYLFVPFYKYALGNKVFFFGDYENRVISSVQELTSKKDKIFVLGTLPHLYYMADRLPAGDQFAFQFPWFMIEAEDKILKGLESDPPKVIIRDETATSQGFKLIDYMQNINGYVNDNYKAIDKVESTEIMVPK